MSQSRSRALHRADDAAYSTSTAHDEDHAYDMNEDDSNNNSNSNDEGYDYDAREQLLRYMVPGSTLDDIVSSEEDERTDRWSRFELVDGNKRGGPGVILDGAECEKLGGAVDSRSCGPGEGCAGCVSRGTNPQVHRGNGCVTCGAGATQEDCTRKEAAATRAKHASSANVMRRIRLDDLHELQRYRACVVGGGDGNAEEMSATAAGGGGHNGHSSHSNNNNNNKKVDRSERATVEHVMDPRTRLILYKLVNSGILREINGCVSTGKEANVYYAVCGDGSDAAIKVFNTSILAFRDRDQYVQGEFRFQRYCKNNPRKMVSTWAEKEARNLCRLQEGGVLAPAVKLLRQHVLVMEFLGEDGWPAPRLKEVRFPSEAALDQCYLDLCCTMRKMFTTCKLIHGDLSEYNLLLYRGRVVVIDVSQSVESDHPRAMDFLRRDIVNVNAFFKSQGHSNLLSYQDLYYFVTATSFAEKIVRSVVSVTSSSSDNVAWTAPPLVETAIDPDHSAPDLNHSTSNNSNFDGNIDNNNDDNNNDCDDTAIITSAVNRSSTRGSLKQHHKGKQSKTAAVRAKKSIRVEPVEELMEWLMALRVRRRAERKNTESSVQPGQCEVDEQVFLRIPVPRTLNEVGERVEPNKDIARFVHEMTVTGPCDSDASAPVLQRRHTRTLEIHKPRPSSSGCHKSNDKTEECRKEEEEDEEQEHEASEVDESETGEDDAEVDEEGEDEAQGERCRREKRNTDQVTLANLTRDERKAHKKLVKEANRERRVQKKQSKKAGKLKAKS